MEDTHQSFLRDFVSWLRHRAEEAASESQTNTADMGFQAGRAMAYVETLGFIQAQADVFLLDKKKLGLDTFEAHELLSKHSRSES